MASCFEPVLGGVGILEFVHQHVIETALPVCETLRMLREQRERKQQEVVEVHGVGLAERRAEARVRSEEHTSELQSPCNLVCRLLLEKKKKRQKQMRGRKQESEQEQYQIARL